ncbi:MAG: ABC transporter ATP-binding protein [Candidatus Lokiarchaeota archaeon]|nr:ABC transporter ATP-binding protein [Candidatus Lokiarchaeota archaeon]
MSQIFIENLSYTYGNDAYALDQVSLIIQKGEMVGIMGRNGAGKSTLIQQLNGLLIPTSGTVFIDGISTEEYDPYELTKKIGIMFQNPEHQLFCSSVEEELDFSLKNLKISKELKTQYKKSTIEKLELQKLLHKSPWNCSGGERKKVSIACVLCRNPDVIVFDEPTLGQDKYGYQILDQILMNAKNENKTTIVVTHNTEFAYTYLDRIIVLERGKILADGPKEKILTNPVILKNGSLVEPQFSLFHKKINSTLSSQDILSSLVSNSRGFNDLTENLLNHIGRHEHL